MSLDFAVLAIAVGLGIFASASFFMDGRQIALVVLLVALVIIGASLVGGVAA